MTELKIKLYKAKKVVDDIKEKHDLRELKRQHNQYMRLYMKKDKDDDTMKLLNNSHLSYTLWRKYTKAIAILKKNAESYYEGDCNNSNNLEKQAEMFQSPSDVAMIQNNQFQNTSNINLDEISLCLENRLNLAVEQTLNQENEVIFCENCKQHQIISEQHLHLYFQIHQKKEILRRKKFRFVSCSNTSNDPVRLCAQCSNYLTIKNRKISVTYDNMWPSFYWYILSDAKIVNIYNHYVWKFVPNSWRDWWLPIVTTIHSNVTKDFPISFFNDKTTLKIEWDKCIECGKIGHLRDICNKSLIPTVLCPWGCTEYLHQSGQFEIDILVQNHLKKCHLKLINPASRLDFIESSRSDYLRKNDNDYECWFFNPLWKIYPCIIFNSKNTPMIMICRMHNNGTKKKSTCA